MSSDLELLQTMKEVYEEQIKRLKEGEKEAVSICERSYRIQLMLWEDRVEQYEKMIQEEKAKEGR